LSCVDGGRCGFRYPPGSQPERAEQPTNFAREAYERGRGVGGSGGGDRRAKDVGQFWRNSYVFHRLVQVGRAVDLRHAGQQTASLSDSSEDAGKARASRWERAGRARRDARDEVQIDQGSGRTIRGWWQMRRRRRVPRRSGEREPGRPSAGSVRAPGARGTASARPTMPSSASTDGAKRAPCGEPAKVERMSAYGEWTRRT